MVYVWKGSRRYSLSEMVISLWIKIEYTFPYIGNWDFYWLVWIYYYFGYFYFNRKFLCIWYYCIHTQRVNETQPRYHFTFSILHETNIWGDYQVNLLDKKWLNCYGKFLIKWILFQFKGCMKNWVGTVFSWMIFIIIDACKWRQVHVFSFAEILA